MSALEPKKSGPVQLAELPGRPGYEVEGEVEPEPEHHADCECEQCDACVPAAEYRADEERREREQDLPFDPRADLGVHCRGW